MVRDHVYYLAASDRVHGNATNDLANALRETWARYKPPRHTTWLDGVSTWIREDGSRVVRLCRGTDVTDISPGELRGMRRASGYPMHNIHRLRELGQSVWLDFIERSMLTSGELERLTEEDGLVGLTSNPTIFQKAIARSTDYDDIIQAAEPQESDRRVLERIAVRDVTLACDQLRAVYDKTGGADGFVSIEVAPSLARNTSGSIEEARRLWRLVSRPNLMVKIPGTREGIAAIEQCLTDGININITLLFSVARYLEVVAAFVRALESRIEDGEPIDRIASVASFFVSRVDAKVDPLITQGPKGQIAIANAKIAYEEYERVFAGDRWQRVASKVARPQRLLWASTSPKSPEYPDVYYVDALIGPHTVDTMTPETFRAYIDHGHPEVRLTKDRERAHELIQNLAKMGIDFPKITQELENEGVRLFAESFDKALESIAEKRRLLRSA